MTRSHAKSIGPFIVFKPGEGQAEDYWQGAKYFWQLANGPW